MSTTSIKPSEYDTLIFFKVVNNFKSFQTNSSKTWNFLFLFIPDRKSFMTTIISDLYF